ncbi:MAG: KamA family radical SAM protein [Sphaerochaetaceae bacterium]|jgi:lysine 2,3-aminomutase|nr:KamA family radical SAM protein [Sphaerochaetaceae bacterium]NLY06952.1 KamA family radical SAM protein [Spirochaetales bacterium]
MDWKNELRMNITDVDELCRYYPMSEDEKRKLKEVERIWPMSISRYYLGLIKEFNSSDPIFKMCIPDVVEMDLNEGKLDTSGEKESTKDDGLQHKYERTALILSTQTCAMYCRHCFRKRLVGLSDAEIAERDERLFRYIREHSEITNVLISGGDAFLNSNARLEKFLKVFTELPNITLVRFGTRTPVTFPQRITGDAELLDILGRYSDKVGIHVVTQFNHPAEVTLEAVASIRALMNQKVVVSNQTVMLKGVNDDSNTLEELMRKLTAVGVVPYYVFQCRPVTGVKQQFQVPIVESYRIIEEARKKLDGLSKRFRYIMSHNTGKIEIFHVAENGDAILKYHQARNPDDVGKVFKHHFDSEDCWLD